MFFLDYLLILWLLPAGEHTWYIPSFNSRETVVVNKYNTIHTPKKKH